METEFELLRQIVQADDPTDAIERARVYVERQLSHVVYCEFCGAAITGIDTPDRLVRWTHNSARDVVRCDRHRRTSKLDRRCRTFNALTGAAR